MHAADIQRMHPYSQYENRAAAALVVVEITSFM